MGKEPYIEDQTAGSIDGTELPEMSSEPTESSFPTFRATSHDRPHVPSVRIAKATAVSALVRGLSAADAAKTAGVSKRTLLEWKSTDPEFIAMLEDTEEEIIGTLRSEAVESSLNDIRDLMPDASKVLTRAIQGEDKRLAMQAATIVLRYSAADVNTSTQLESMLQTIDAKPTDGD